MGLFNKKKTTYHSSSQLLYEDVKGIVEQTVLSATVRNLNIAEALADNIVNGVLTRATAMYRYGKRTEDGGNGYYLGLPYGTKSYISTARETTTKLLIQNETSDLIHIDSYVFDKDFAQHYAHDFIQNNRGWDSTSNIITNPPFDPEGHVVYYHEAEVLADNSVKIVYINDVSTLYEETIAVANLAQGELYYYVTYRVLDTQANPSGEVIYWDYKESSGVYPELDVHEIDEDIISPFYPVVPIRQDSVDLTDAATRNEAEYSSSKQCLRYISVDIDQVVEGLNENPDIGDVDHAYIMMAVDLATQKSASKTYLYEFFHDIATTSKLVQKDYDYWEANEKENSPPPVNTIVIADANFKNEISWNYINKTSVTGSIGAINEVTIETGTITPPTDEYGYTYPTTVLYVRKQIGANEYVELLIKGLQHANYIYPNRTITTDVESAFSGDTPLGNFVIPVNHVIAKNMGTLIAHDMLHDAVRIVFNSKIVTKLKWYETSAFKILAVVLVVVYSVLTTDFAGGFNWLAAVMVAGEVLLEMIVFNLVLGHVMQYARDLLGEELTLLLAIAATAAGLQFDMTGVSFAGMSTAGIYSAVTNAVTGLANMQFQSDLRSLAREQEEIDAERELYMESHEDDMDDPLNLLGLGSNYTYTYDVVKDSPSYYYTRTIHAGFVDTNALTGPEYYVDGQLNLDLPYSPLRTRVY